MGDDGIEWELEDLDGGVLYDVFYESTTMLAGRMLAQRRLAAARGDRDGERLAEADRRGLLAARGKVGPTDREALVRAKRAADSERGARAERAADSERGARAERRPMACGRQGPRGRRGGHLA